MRYGKAIFSIIFTFFYKIDADAVNIFIDAHFTFYMRYGKAIFSIIFAFFLQN